MANYGSSGGWGGPPPPHPDQIFRGGYGQGSQYYHLQRDGHPGYPNHHADSEGYTYDYIDDTYIGPRGGYTNRGNGQYNSTPHRPRQRGHGQRGQTDRPKQHGKSKYDRGANTDIRDPNLENHNNTENLKSVGRNLEKDIRLLQERGVIGEDKVKSILHVVGTTFMGEDQQVEEESADAAAHDEADVAPTDADVTSDKSLHTELLDITKQQEGNKAIQKLSLKCEGDEELLRFLERVAVLCNKDDGKPAEDDTEKKLDPMDKVTKIMFEDEGHFKTCVQRRSRELFKDDQDLLPEQLLGFKLENFEKLLDYDEYMIDVFRVLLCNRLFIFHKSKLEGYVRPDHLPDWTGSYHDWIPDKYKLENYQPQKEGSVVEGPQGDNTTPQHQLGGNDTHKPLPTGQADIPHTSSKKITFTAGAGLGRTFTQDKSHQRYGNTHSTPYGKSSSMPNQGGHDVSGYSDIPTGQSDYDQEAEATYNKYGIPDRFRKKPSGGSQGPMLSSTIGGTTPHQATTQATTQVSTPGVMSALHSSAILDMFTKFYGGRDKYITWKETTQALLGRVEEDLQGIWLKRLLSSKYQGLVKHIRDTDVGAVEEIWHTLDIHLGGDTDQTDYHMEKLQSWLRDGAKCDDYDSLLHLYTYLQEHYYGLVRLGHDKVPLAESVIYGLPSLLYGRSAKEVNRLKDHRNSKEPFTMKAVLHCIENHLRDLGWNERDRDKLHAQDDDAALLRSYSKHDIPYLRKVYKPKDYGGWKGYHNSRYGSKHYNRSESRHRSSSRDSYRDSRNRSSSRDSYYGKYQRKGYRSDSRDSRFYGKGGDRDSYNDKYQGYSSSRDNYSKYESRDRHDHEDRGRDRARRHSKKYDGYKRDFSSDRSKSRDSSAGSHARIYSATGMVQFPKGDKEEKRRSRDQTPGRKGYAGRGSQSRSPMRSSGYQRSPNTFDCTLCLKDGHDTFSCRSFSADEVFRLCHERRLCMVCYLTGHQSSRCKVTDYCKDKKCDTDLKHHSSLCGKFRGKD